MEIKTSKEVQLGVQDKEWYNKKSNYNDKTTKERKEFELKKWVALDDEVKEALALYYHLKNHTEVQNATTYTGMPICKICNKPAYQIMAEEFEKLTQ